MIECDKACTDSYSQTSETVQISSTDHHQCPAVTKWPKTDVAVVITSIIVFDQCIGHLTGHSFSLAVVQSWSLYRNACYAGTKWYCDKWQYTQAIQICCNTSFCMFAIKLFFAGYHFHSCMFLKKARPMNTLMKHA